jgi:hypothetical protein
MSEQARVIGGTWHGTWFDVPEKRTEGSAYVAIRHKRLPIPPPTDDYAGDRQDSLLGEREHYRLCAIHQPGGTRHFYVPVGVQYPIDYLIEAAATGKPPEVETF